MVSRVCIIDDDEISVYLTTLVLEEAGIARNISFYYSADEAYEALLCSGERVPEVILLDLNMPHKSGWDFLDMLREREEELLGKTCVFILTSSIAEQDKEHSCTYPLVRGFLHKPLEEESLAQIRNICAWFQERPD